MAKLHLLLLMFLSWNSMIAVLPPARGLSFQESTKVVATYDRTKNKTTVRLAPVQISGAKGKYHSLHMAPAFSYPGQKPRMPEIIDFELQTVVKGKLKVDLYVLFIVDGEKIFLSSNRWGEKKGKLGRRWMGEHLVFRMPYETFSKIINSRTFEITFDGVSFPVGVEQIEMLRMLDKQIKMSAGS